MKRWSFAVLVVAVAILLASASVAVGDTDAYVDAQVTMSYVSVRVTLNGNIDYGAMTLNQSKMASDVNGGYTRFENDGTLASDWQMYTAAPWNGSNSLVLGYTPRGWTRRCGAHFSAMACTTTTKAISVPTSAAVSRWRRT